MQILEDGSLYVPFICKECKKPIETKVNMIGTVYYCSPCLREKICYYCDPPRAKEECEGHRFSPTTNNRFMDDKEFVAGTKMELE